MNLTRGIALVAAFGVLATVAGGAAAAAPQTLVVDDDGVQCAGAGFTSIEAAIDAAQASDLIRVCPGLYAESVTIDKPLTLKADPDAIEALDCFQSTLPELATNQYAILDPAGEGFSIGFELDAEGVVVEGFVIQGASVGIDAGDRFSGYRIHHNLIRSNTLFAIDFGSSGTRESRVDHNCIRGNQYGLVSELDDDSAWSPTDKSNRGLENARDVANARIDHNATFGNRVGLDVAGPGRHDDLTLDHNDAREDVVGIALQNSERSRIVDNELGPMRNAILVGGATSGLTMTDNVVDAGQQAIVFVPATAFIDIFTAPVTGALVAGNSISGQTLDAILAVAGRLHDSFVVNNVASDNLRDGIRIGLGNTGNVVRDNVADRNGRYGVYAQGATGNVFEANAMLGNGVLDARDDNRPANTWLANQCVTDFPAGTICGIG